MQSSRLKWISNTVTDTVSNTFTDIEKSTTQNDNKNQYGRCDGVTGGSGDMQDEIIILVGDEITNQNNERKKIIISSTEPRNLCHTVTHATQISLEYSSNEGLDYILRHFEHQSHIWPRTISTKSTQARQIVVNSKENALVYFKMANYLDCRISAYPYWRPSLETGLAGIKNAIAPNLIMIDLDLHSLRL